MLTNSSFKIGTMLSLLAASQLSCSQMALGGSTKPNIGAEVDKMEKQSAADHHAWYKKVQSAKTEAERNRLFESEPDPAKYIPRLYTLMRNSPNDPASAKAALWIVTTAKKPEQAHEAITAIKKYHLKSKELDEVVGILWFKQNPELTDLLRAYIAKRQNKEMETRAKYALARMQLAEKSNDAALKLFNEIERDGAKVSEHKGSARTLSEVAKSYIFEMTNLAVGKQVANIEGTDVFGKKLRLSDFAGKVIMLDFFGFW